MSDELLKLSELLRNAANVFEENERLTKEIISFKKQLEEHYLLAEIHELRKKISDQDDELKMLHATI